MTANIGLSKGERKFGKVADEQRSDRSAVWRGGDTNSRERGPRVPRPRHLACEVESSDRARPRQHSMTGETVRSNRIQLT